MKCQSNSLGINQSNPSRSKMSVGLQNNTFNPVPDSESYFLHTYICAKLSRFPLERCWNFNRQAALLKICNFLVHFQSRTGCRRWSSSGTSVASAPPSPSETQPRISPSSTWCTTSSETATLTTLLLVKMLNWISNWSTLRSWAVTIAFSNEQCTCSQPCLLMLLLRAQCERDLRSYGPFTPAIYNAWTIAWTEITKRGYRTHSLTIQFTQ